MPLAIPVQHLAQAQERWNQAEKNGTKYMVPGSEVEVDVGNTKNAMPSKLLGLMLGLNTTPGESEDHAITERIERDIDDALTENELASYPWWKIERRNNRAAHTGYGVYVPLGRQCKFATVVWMGHRWSEEEKAQYHATRQLPVCFHQGDVSPDTPVLLIRVLLAKATDMGFTTTVSGWDLEEGRFPCLYYVDGGTYRMRNIERSGLLFPSEYINRDMLNKQHAASVGKTDLSESDGSVAYDANLERCLLAPCVGFHVREGKDFDDAIVNFANAQSHDAKSLTWYRCEEGTLTATLQYGLSARELWQAIADEWIPGGVIRLP
jgi:hypothetical protein